MAKYQSQEAKKGPLTGSTTSDADCRPVCVRLILYAQVAHRSGRTSRMMGLRSLLSICGVAIVAALPEAILTGGGGPSIGTTKNATGHRTVTKFGTWPFSDARFEGPQVLPGRVHLAYYDFGGFDKAYHSYEDKNFGSCALNPCDGQYKNMFRKDEGGSTSYTKPPNGGWPGDTFAINGSHVPIDDMYWGWLALGSWVRVSVLLKQSGTYSATIFGTCNSGGEIKVSLDYDDDENKGEVVTAHVPSTGQYHKWAVASHLFLINAPSAGPAVLTVNVTGIDEPAGQLGNIMWLDFDVLDRP